MNHFPYLHTFFLPVELKVMLWMISWWIVKKKKQQTVLINIAVTLLLKIA